MQIALGELVDRLTICTRKVRLQVISATEEEIQEIIKSIVESLDTLSTEKKFAFISDICKLADLNYQIWHLEFDLRTAEEKDLDDALVGRRAKRIRNLNMQRNGIRSMINEYSKTGYRIVNL